MYISEEKALKKVELICSKQEKCKYDIKKKLTNWELKPDSIDRIISKLEKDNFIDEKRYSSFFVRDKFRFNKWGKIKILFTLRQKNIPDKYIFVALNKIDDKEYIKTLEKEIKKKQKLIKYETKYELKSKLLRFAESRGFEKDLIFKIIDKFG
ncbi:MAG: RecX family transcriptional regulator [Bacteroidetes bacterium]|nr:MAG: RecX family transcriptional regulator [Bacteroidota bacterium]